VLSVAFSPNGRTLAVGENDGNTMLFDRSLWDWTFPTMQRLLCGEARANLTKAQSTTYIPTLPVQKSCPGYP
jgi:WD40 repeat protein